MADEDVNKPEQEQDYEEPSLTDLEDVSGGGVTCANGSINLDPDQGGPAPEEA